MMGFRFMFIVLCLAAFPGAVALVPPLPLTAATTAVVVSRVTSAALVLATETDMELTELPPPYVPALFGVALLIGVGVLTGSLGNVMDEEALRTWVVLFCFVLFGVTTCFLIYKITLHDCVWIRHCHAFVLTTLLYTYYLYTVGMQSGARAKKEIERSRSSYFKKK